MDFFVFDFRGEWVEYSLIFVVIILLVIESEGAATELLKAFIFEKKNEYEYFQHVIVIRCLNLLDKKYR